LIGCLPFKVSFFVGAISTEKTKFREQGKYCRVYILEAGSLLARQQKELEEVRKEAAAIIRRSEERIQETEQLLALQLAKLTELEGV
jgi:hypothetical protein